LTLDWGAGISRTSGLIILLNEKEREIDTEKKMESYKP
jgi:hypothetical protein